MVAIVNCVQARRAAAGIFSEGSVEGARREARELRGRDVARTTALCSAARLFDSDPLRSGLDRVEGKYPHDVSTGDRA